MRNKTIERQAKAQGQSLKRAGQFVWFVAVVVAVLLAWAVFSLAQFIKDDATRVERTLHNNEAP